MGQPTWVVLRKTDDGVTAAAAWDTSWSRGWQWQAGLSDRTLRFATRQEAESFRWRNCAPDGTEVVMSWEQIIGVADHMKE